LKTIEPPSLAIVLIGRNSRGQWVAQQQDGLFGGLFVHRTDALRYALFENGHHPEAIVAIAGCLELNMGDVAAAPHTLPYTADRNHRRVA
jgi:hypothetical protein